MKCRSSRFGTFEVVDGTVLTFPAGLLGFPDQQRYVILDHDRDAPFKWLQSLDEPELAFVIIDPALFDGHYQVESTSDALAELGGGKADEITVAVILTIPSDDPARITANLRGPLLMNPRTKLCKQLVLSEDFPTRYPLFPPTTAEAAGAAQAVSTAACPA
jgi:flagellar assembly factor FliW